MANFSQSPGSSPRISMPTVRNLIAVASGKGGVGKSTVTANLAVALAQQGLKVGLLDADIYGPSIPVMMGLDDRPETTDTHVKPLHRHGLAIMSMGFLVPPDQAVVWRGPMVHGALTQFLTQVEWGDLDFLLIDMPPGTGDAQLTISQNAPLTGAIIVTTPQAVAVADARRGVRMFQNVQVPILGIIENMSGGPFGQGGGKRLAEELQVPLLGTLGLDGLVAATGDAGTPVVLAEPASASAQAFSAIAGALSAQFGPDPSNTRVDFKPFAMEWRA